LRFSISWGPGSFLEGAINRENSMVPSMVHPSRTLMYP
jgi:hypothetical protein